MSSYGLDITALIVAQFASQALDVYGKCIVINKTSYVIPEDIEDPVTVQQLTCVIYEDQQELIFHCCECNFLTVPEHLPICYINGILTDPAG